MDPFEVANPILDKHPDAIAHIADGVSMWDDNSFPEVAALRKDCKQYILIVKHHTQSTEAGVQDISICSSCGRNEVEASALSAIRSQDNRKINAEMMAAFQYRVKRSNQHMGPGVGSERELRSKQSRRRRFRGQIKAKPRIHKTKRRAAALISHGQNTTPTEEDRKIVRSEMKIQSEGSSRVPNSAKKMRLEQSSERRQQAVDRVAMRTMKGLSVPLSENLDTAFATIPAKINGRMKLKSMKRTKFLSLTKDELGIREISFNESEKGIGVLVQLLIAWNIENDTADPENLLLLTAAPPEM